MFTSWTSVELLITIGIGHGRAARILLEYNPSHTSGISLRPKARTQCPFPAFELYNNQAAGPSQMNNRRRNRRAPPVTVAAQQGEIDLPSCVPQVRIRDTGISSSGNTTFISPSDYFAEQDMSLAAMVSRAGSKTPVDSPSSTPPVRTLASGSPTQRALEQTRRNKRTHHEAFGQDDEEDQLSVRQLQERNRATSPILRPLVVAVPSSSELPPAWAPTFQRGDRPINVGDSAGSMDTTIALAQALQLPADVAKENESTLERLRGTRSLIA